MSAAFLNIAKPRGMTSHDVVARVRRMLGERRVGHAGTLDPLAEGVLPVALGRATRLADRVGEGEKIYYARVHLGVATSTDDAEGEVVRNLDVGSLSIEQVEAALDRFRGSIQQVPPAYSAIKIGGQPAYRAARRGESLSLSPRPVTIYELRLLAWRSSLATLLVRCSRGTYIRSLARDLGEALRVGGHLAALVRLAVGRFHLSWAISLEELQAHQASGRLDQVLVAPDIALLDAPAVVVCQEREADFRHGRSWPAPSRTQHPVPNTDRAALSTQHPALGTAAVRAYTPDGRLLGLMDYDFSAGRWQPRLALCD